MYDVRCNVLSCKFSAKKKETHAKKHRVHLDTVPPGVLSHTAGHQKVMHLRLQKPIFPELRAQGKIWLVCRLELSMGINDCNRWTGHHRVRFNSQKLNSKRKHSTEPLNNEQIGADHLVLHSETVLCLELKCTSSTDKGPQVHPLQIFLLLSHYSERPSLEVLM